MTEIDGDLLSDAATAMSAAYDAAPDGEGCAGAEFIAMHAARNVLGGMAVPEAVAQAVKDGNSYGGTARYILVDTRTPSAALAVLTNQAVAVPREALLWLNGEGDYFEPSVGARGAFWWRAEFARRIAVSPWAPKDTAP